METKALINFKEGTVELIGSEEFILKYLETASTTFMGVETEQKKKVKEVVFLDEIKQEVAKPVEEIVEGKKNEPVKEEPTFEVKVARRGRKKAVKPFEVIAKVANRGRRKTIKTVEVEAKVSKRGRKRKELPAIVEPQQTIKEVKTEPAVVKNLVQKGRKKETKITTKIFNNKDIFDFQAEGTVPALEEFLTQKNPGKTASNVILTIGYYLTKLKGAKSFTFGNIEYAYTALSIPNKPIHIPQAVYDAANKKKLFEAESRGNWKLTGTGVELVEKGMAG